MEILGENKKYAKLKSNVNTVVALGNFDGIHLGHKALLDKIVEISRERGLFSVLYTFEHHTEFIINPAVKHKNIVNNEEKLKLIEKFHIDAVYLETFDKAFASLTCEDFVKDVLVSKLSCKCVVVGEDYSFGKEGKGGAPLLAKLCRENGIDSFIVPSVVACGNIVSSTIIKDAIKSGDFESFKRYTGREYSISGVVLHGRKVGRTIGFPTANLIPDEDLVYPDHGVYFTKTIIMETAFYSITNVGNNPTFDLSETTIETHLIDKNMDLYDKKIEVVFIKKIRGEIKFNSVDELKSQLNEDLKTAKLIMDNLSL